MKLYNTLRWTFYGLQRAVYNFLKDFFSDALTFLLFVRSVQVLKPVKNSPQNLKRHSSLFLYNVKQCLFEGNSFPRLHQKKRGKL